ncbi:hypothetical protein MKK58_02945 [Methylobacterium sp. J-078]|uniref:hypothetical protein n=1 Tax=Methylobacterium sp. J-078 TaxID=2836657 RepID=UPI001FBA7488|nr:hypothetical protein [Methylobacterium sp. J-078]MCJ2043500.1 hypothetical protein [Methylobacterium sp. J-078]
MRSSEGQPERLPEQIAIGLVQDAEAYRLAALRVQPRDAPIGEVDLIAPAWHLLCHSAELALKAFLLSNGADPGSKPGGLKHPALRHNLLGLYEAAVAQGFAPPDAEFGELMEWLAPYHSAHDFRYRKPGLVSLAAPFFIAEVLEPVIARVEGTVRERWRTRRGSR